MKKFIRHLTVATFTVAAMASTACNTVSGVGQDAQSAGKTVEDVANDAKN